jgi:Tol biopolymer transport system component
MVIEKKLLVAGIFLIYMFGMVGFIYGGTTSRVSTDSNGNQGNDGSYHFNAISGDGRYVTFMSYANNLVPGDTNNTRDIFVHDRITGITERVSVDSNGNQGNNLSTASSISYCGRYIAFDSDASNLVPGDTNGISDVFVHDRQTGITERVSIDSFGNEGNGHSHNPFISPDGRYVTFTSGSSNLVPGDTNGMYDVFVHDRQTGITERVSIDSNGNQGNGMCGFSSIDANGRYVVFDSDSNNLVPNDTNGTRDIFVHDRLTGITERVNVGTNGKQTNGFSDLIHGRSISGDGMYVVFRSGATNLDPRCSVNGDTVFSRDRVRGNTKCIASNASGSATISTNGRYVVFFSSDSNLVHCV